MTWGLILLAVLGERVIERLSHTWEGAQNLFI